MGREERAGQVIKSLWASHLTPVFTPDPGEDPSKPTTPR